jgi:hypothetical protein|tara:strand:+ start:1376 stop:1813 length:438 start_codon:yes stop_codon:yes gene_type:complete
MAKEVANIRIFKLINGDDVVAHLPQGEKQLPEKSPLVRISKPLQIKYIPQMTSMGIRDYIALIKWVNYTPDKVVNIPKDKIMTITLASEDMVSSYMNLAKDYDKLDQPKKASKSIFKQEKISEEDNEILNEIFKELDGGKKRTIH